MIDLSVLFSAIPPMLGLATLAWLFSLVRKDASIVDSFWSLFFVSALLTWVIKLDADSVRASVVMGLILLWASRLSIYLTFRNWGKPEDRRYQTIRQRNQPHYEVKSLFYVFYLQVALAFIIAVPILPAVASDRPLSLLDLAGSIFFLIGLAIESIADLQMTRFKSRKDSKGKVLRTGLWAFSRHPNYFGESLLWWGFGLIALAAGAPFWILVSPAFMTFLLTKVSGVPLLEEDLKSRSPDYCNYIETTSSFWPRRPGDQK
jgi:steroid 5-alpha reductase family enzyme